MSKSTGTAKTVIGAAIITGALAVPAAANTGNPFLARDLGSGYQLASHDPAKTEGEHKCGEAKCGGDKTGSGSGEDKSGEGKCGGDKKGSDSGEGKCGEGKCGADKWGADSERK